MKTNKGGVYIRFGCRVESGIGLGYRTPKSHILLTDFKFI